MFRYKDLKEEEEPVAHEALLTTSTNLSFTLQIYSHLCMSQGFTGDVALHLGLINGIDRHPHQTAPYCNSPESMSFERIGVKTTVKVTKYKLVFEDNINK